MSTQLKPIALYGKGGPNPPKVAILLEELKLPYTIVDIPFSDVKKPEYTAINPNGRVPAIQDPNTGLTLWESGAIIEYLVESYDKDHRISFKPGTPEYFHAKQWLFFQTTGQAPYYGQAVWFGKYHPEQVPSAVERYAKEVNRVSGVLDGWLAKQKENHAGSGDGPWLVGNKLSYADLSFVTWQKIILRMLTKEQFTEDDYPNLKDWLNRITERESVGKIRKSGHTPW
jgi:glutathione S-transferase